MYIELFQELLAKPMTRKEFLAHLGVLLLVLTGISGLLKTLSDPHIVSTHTSPKARFGAGRYGG